MSNSEFEQRLAIAQFETTSLETLTELAADREAKIRWAVSKNPNTPVEILFKLGEEFPTEVTENPIFQLLVLENPNDIRIKLMLARSITTDQKTLIKLSEMGEEERFVNPYYVSMTREREDLLFAIAQNPKTPTLVLQRFFQRCVDEYNDERFEEWSAYSDERIFDEILSAIAQNPNSPELLQSKIANFGSWEVQNLIAKNPNTTTSILEDLVNQNSPTQFMCRAILRHPNVSEATIIAILRRSVSFLESIPELGTSSEAKGVQAEFVETWQEIQDTAQKALQRKRSIG